MKKSKALKQFTDISYWANELLEKVPDEFEVDTNRKFKFVTLKDLGFTDYVETKEFLNNEFLAKHGLSLCNPEDVFQITKEITDYVVVGMNPITDRSGGPGVFYLYSDDAELKLRGNYAGPGFGWYPGSQFVFLASTQNSDTQTLPSETLNLELAIQMCKDAGLTVTKIY